MTSQRKVAQWSVLSVSVLGRYISDTMNVLRRRLEDLCQLGFVFPFFHALDWEQFSGWWRKAGHEFAGRNRHASSASFSCWPHPRASLRCRITPNASLFSFHLIVIHLPPCGLIYRSRARGAARRSMGSCLGARTAVGVMVQSAVAAIGVISTHMGPRSRIRSE